MNWVWGKTADEIREDHLTEAEEKNQGRRKTDDKDEEEKK